MIKKIINLSLRRQLVILFCISILLVMMTQLYYTISIYRRDYEQNKEKCDSIILQTDSMLTLVSDRIMTTGRTVSNNSFVQEMLNLNNSDKVANLKRRMELTDLIHNYLNGIISSNEELSDIAVIDNTNTIITTNNLFTFSNYTMIKGKYNLQDLKKGFFTSYLGNGFGYVLPIYYTTGNFKDINHRLGTCVIWFKKNSLNEIVVTTAATEEATVLIVHSEGNIMALNSKYNQPELTEEIDQMLSNHSRLLQNDNIQKMTFMKQQCFVLMKDHVNTGWKSINIVPIKSIYTEALHTLYLGMYLAIASILILLVFGFFMIRSISRPLTSITSVLDSIGNGKRKQRIEIVDKNEFGIISESINTMLDNVENMNQRIFTMQSELYEKELMQKESEMLALQSQINPHFLYNTLECIRSIATIHKIKEISVITTSMAKIFRYSIKGGLTTTVEKELECVNDYYKIIAIRFYGRLKMNFTVDERLFPFSILKMSLQPIIENSVYHGLEAIEGDVVVDLKAWIDGDYAIISIEDNGIGIEPEKVNELNDIFGKPLRESIADVSMSKSSIGLANINTRIKLHYGEECGLNIQSTSNVNTTVILKIKLKKV